MKSLRPFVLILALSVPVILGSFLTHAQSFKRDAAVPRWQIDAGLRMSFDAATVQTDPRPPALIERSNVPLGPGEYYAPTGGLFSATDFPLAAYILFAYKLSGDQNGSLEKQLPKWTFSDRFDIQARVEGNPTKDQMRLMMQTLLEDQFRLFMHWETRQLPVYALVLNKAGDLGPGLQPHTGDAPCSTDPRRPTPDEARTTVLACAGIQQISASVPGRAALGGRGVTMELIANSLVGGNVDRPVIEKTGLAGTFDVHIEFGEQADSGASHENKWRRPGPAFVEALKEQLGLKLEPQTAPVQVFVVDHIDEPSAN
jgi:uncharacterized protein (TIGR03435 family)